ncbi:MAG: signal peptidase II [Thermodesulfobacteriota bacterium]|nr:signal peptidase II [Thermodesulfobacteriota bacterium]
MKKKYLITTIIALGVITLDQSLKLYVDRVVPLYHSISIIKDFVDITYVRNSGAAFGFLAGQVNSLRLFFFTTLTVAAIVVIFILLKKLKDNQLLLISSLSLIMGGAVGNLIDRVRIGEVIDFIDIHWHSHHWPAFNVADSAITIGGIFWVIEILFKKRSSFIQAEK